MTVSTNDNKIIYAGNGTTVAFPVPFLFYDDAHIVVRIKKDETVTDCVRGVDYSIAGAGNGNGGTVTFAVAPDNGTQVAILRDVPFVQNTQYLDGDPLPAELLERNLDILTMQTQQLKEQADRAVSLDTFSGSNPSQIVGKIEGLYDDRDKLITVAEHIAAVDVCSDNIEAIKSAPTYAADAHASLTASLLAEASAADSATEAANQARASADSAASAAASAAAARVGLATDAEFAAGTATNKAPTVKQSATLALNKANADADNFTAAGKSVLSGFGLPSGDGVDLTAGASGSTYTAPANGWFSVYNASGQSNSVQLYNQTKKIGIGNAGITGFTDGMTFVPAAKDDVVMLKYTGAFNSSKTGWFRFIYAQGEQNV